MQIIKTGKGCIMLFMIEMFEPTYYEFTAKEKYFVNSIEDNMYTKYKDIYSNEQFLLVISEES